MARKSVIEMYSTYNEVKPVVTESFIRALTLFRMALFGTANRWGGGGAKCPLPKNLSHISYKEKAWHNYTLSKEDPKYI